MEKIKDITGIIIAGGVILAAAYLMGAIIYVVVLVFKKDNKNKKEEPLNQSLTVEDCDFITEYYKGNHNQFK